MTDDAEKLLVLTFLKNRDEHAFRQLYRIHAKPLYRLALHFSGSDKETVEDVLQEAWIRAVDRLPEFRWQSSLRTWLSGIVINCCRENNRKKVTAPISDELTSNLMLQHSMIEHKLDIQTALTQLSEGYREVLVLHDMEGYKHHEISEMLGINEGTSKSQLFHARRIMRKIMK